MRFVSVQEMVLTRPAVDDRIPAALLRPARARKQTAALVVSDKGIEAFYDGNQPAHPLVARLLGKGRTVLLIDPWGIGKAAIPASRDRRAAKISQYLTYNRSDDAQRIQDILTALGYLRSLRAVSRIELVGLGCAGPWALFARTQAPFVRRTVVDMQACRLSRDADFIDHLHIPAIRSIGDVLGAIGLIAPSMLCLLKPRAGFDIDAARQFYAAAGKPAGNCLHERIGAECWIT